MPEATATPPRQDGVTDEHRVRGTDLLGRVKQIVHEGNVRRIIIQDETGRTIIEVPMTVGVVGVALIPVWVAIGAIAALIANFRVVVVRHEKHAT